MTIANPYGTSRIERTADTDKPRSFFTREGEPALDAWRHEKGASRFFSQMGDHYEINAGNKKELMARIASLQSAVMRGEVSKKLDPELRNRRFAEFRAAYDEARRDDTKFRVIGEVMSDEILN